MLTASIREIRQKTFLSAIVFGPVVENNRNKLPRSGPAEEERAEE